LTNYLENKIRSGFFGKPEFFKNAKKKCPA